MGERLYAKYLLRTALEAEQVAATVAGEQSSGTFIATPGESAELKQRSGALVEFLHETEDSGDPVLTGSKLSDVTGAKIRSYEMLLSWPMENMGPSLPNIMATVAGNLFELKQVAGLKLLDIEFPPGLAERYPGPAFGVTGTRALSGVEGRPLIGTIIKPSVGLDPQATADLVQDLCAGGIDFIKDDELQADGPHCPFEERFNAVMDVIDRHHDKTGQKVMYAANITGELDEMMARHDLVEQRGGTCIMISLNSVGLTGLLPKALISTYLSFFPVVVGMVKGLRSPDPMHIDLMRTYKASRMQLFWKLRLPASVPFLFASMKVAIAISLVGAIVGELPTGAIAGLGARLLAGSYYGQTIQIWSALISAACMAAILISIVGIISHITLKRMGLQQ